MNGSKDINNKNNVIINSVDRTIDIFEYVYKQGTEVSISQISKDLDIYKSTVFRSLATLEHRGYVIQDPKTEMYTVGPKLYVFDNSRYTGAIAASCKPFLKQLNDKYKEAVNLGVLDKTYEGLYRIVMIDGLESKHNLGVSFDFSSQDECYCASLGKVLLAFSDNVDLSVYKTVPLEKFTTNTITTFDGLLSELNKIRECGYALDNEEREIGLVCLGVPIFYDDKCVAALSISGPSFRIRQDLEEKIAYMKELSRTITKSIF